MVLKLSIRNGEIKQGQKLLAAPSSVQGKETGQKTALSRYELCVGEHTRTFSPAEEASETGPHWCDQGSSAWGHVTNAMGAFALHGYTVCAQIKHKSLPLAIQLFNNTSFAQENYNGNKQTLKKQEYLFYWEQLSFNNSVKTVSVF